MVVDEIFCQRPLTEVFKGKGEGEKSDLGGSLIEYAPGTYRCIVTLCHISLLFILFTLRYDLFRLLTPSYYFLVALRSWLFHIY